MQVCDTVAVLCNTDVHHDRVNLHAIDHFRGIQVYFILNVGVVIGQVSLVYPGEPPPGVIGIIDRLKPGGALFRLVKLPGDVLPCFIVLVMHIGYLFAGGAILLIHMDDPPCVVIFV